MALQQAPVRRRTSSSPAPPQAGLASFLRATWDELRKVVWPTPTELYRYTLVVLLTVIVIGVFIGAVDYGLSAVAKRFIYGALSAGAPGAPTAP